MKLFVVSERHRVSYCRFCENSASKLLIANNDGTLWAEFTHNKEVSEKAFCTFVWGYFLIQDGIQRYPRHHLWESTKWVLANSPNRGWCNTVKWIHTAQSRFSESFIPLYLGGYFLCSSTPQTHWKYNFSESTETVLGNGSNKLWCNSEWWSNT